MQIRPMQMYDIEAVASLSTQLGYPAEIGQAEARFRVIASNPSHGLFVAQEDSNAIIGWVHIYGVFLMESEGYAEIGGLVVDEETRLQGVGRSLMSAAEGWAQTGNYSEVRLRSGLHRLGAHNFYKRIGYTLTKTSYMFRKSLSL